MSENLPNDRRVRIDPRTAHVIVLGDQSEPLAKIEAELRVAGYHVTHPPNEAVVKDGSQPMADVAVIAAPSPEQACGMARRLRESSGQADVPIIFLLERLASSDRQVLAACGGICALCMPVDPVQVAEWIERSLWSPHIYRNSIPTRRSHAIAEQDDWISLSDD